MSGRKGFALIVLLMVIALVGGAVGVLAQVSGTMGSRTRQMHLEACARNLQASGRAWAERNAPARGAGPSQPTELDLRDFGLSDATLTVTFLRAAGQPERVRVDSRCASAGQSIRRSATHNLPAGR